MSLNSVKAHMQLPNDSKPGEKTGLLQQVGRAFFAGCRGFGARDWGFAKSFSPESNDEPDADVAIEDPPGGGAGEWPDRLAQEKEILRSFVSGMESEFLATGEGLMGMAGQLSDIQKDCESLADLTRGQTQEAGAQFAFQLLKKAEDLVLASYEQYDHVFGTFNELQERLAQLSRQHDKLMRVLSPLTFIMIAFRVEASRHPSEVRQAFLVLADNVNRTVTEVRGTVERQFEELAASERLARSLIEQVSASNERRREETARILKMSRGRLGALNDAVSISGAAASSLLEINQAVTRDISGMIMAQQCQDITRQKIEHVGEAIDDMRAHLENGGSSERVIDSETRQFVAHAAQIQVQQTRRVFDDLDRAADGLLSGIHSLRAQAGAANDVAVKLGCSAVDANIAGECQDGIADVLRAVEQAVDRIAEILAAFQPLQARFVDCTGKATELAGDVRYAALNAQIFAINAPNGAALEALASRVRVISDEAIEQVGQMGGALQDTNELVSNLNQRLEDFECMGRAEHDVLATESALSQNKISELNSAVPALIRQITLKQEALSQAVGETLAKVQFPGIVAKTSSRSIDLFQNLEAWAGEGGDGLPLNSAASRKIDLLKAKYTMDSERHAHAAATKSVPKNDADPGAEIELFDDFAHSLPTGDGLLDEAPLQNQGSDEPSKRAEFEATSIPSAPKEAPVSDDLGDNVELF